MTEVCDDCGKIIETGEWPWCPHGHTRMAVHADDIPGGLVVENGFAEPITVYSHSEHRRRLAAEGLEIKAKWVPGDQHLTRWDTVDLQAAKTLLERGPQAIREKQARWPSATIPITVKDAGVIRQKVSTE